MGRDVYRSDNIVIQNSVINNGDGMYAQTLKTLWASSNTPADCVSFKPNSTNILVQNLHCNGSHGISVGSLGQYKGEVDIVQNVLIYNISMFNASVSPLASLDQNRPLVTDTRNRTEPESKSGLVHRLPCLWTCREVVDLAVCRTLPTTRCTLIMSTGPSR